MSKKYIMILILLTVLILGAASYYTVKKLNAPKVEIVNNSSVQNILEYTVIEDQIKLWKEPNENSQTAAVLKVGDNLRVTGKTDYSVKLRGTEEFWYNASYNNVHGWVHGQYICKKEEFNKKVISAYEKKLKDLSQEDYKSVLKAFDYAKPYLEVNKDKQINDDIFRKFQKFYESIGIKTHVSEDMAEYLMKYGEKGDSSSVLPEDAAKYAVMKSKVEEIMENGYRFIYPEGMPELVYDYGFLHSRFSKYVSEGIEEYLRINKNEQLKVPVIEDAGLAITWDDLAARIIVWEDFIKKYPNIKETEYANSAVKFYLQIYTGRLHLDNALVFDYQENKLQDNVKQSYERFIMNYQSSKYFMLIKGYYDILKKNNWVFNNQADEYLNKNNIKKSGS